MLLPLLTTWETTSVLIPECMRVVNLSHWVSASSQSKSVQPGIRRLNLSSDMATIMGNTKGGHKWEQTHTQWVCRGLFPCVYQCAVRSSCYFSLNNRSLTTSFPLMVYPWMTASWMLVEGAGLLSGCTCASCFFPWAMLCVRKLNLTAIQSMLSLIFLQPDGNKP